MFSGLGKECRSVLFFCFFFQLKYKMYDGIRYKDATIPSRGPLFLLSSLELGKFFSTFFCRRNPQCFFFVIVEVTCVTWSFTLGDERRFNLLNEIAPHKISTSVHIFPIRVLSMTQLYTNSTINLSKSWLLHKKDTGPMN